jgi:hypothetical protein
MATQKEIIKLSLKAVFAVTLLVAGIFAYLFFSSIKSTGGPNYNPDLTKIAKSALPIIKQATDYFATNARYPADAGELRKLVKDPRSETQGDALLENTVLAPDAATPPVLWAYGASGDGQGFQLVCGLASSQALRYAGNKTQGAWHLMAADGKDIPILLSP